MSKVVHLSDEAHNRAKDFCRVNGYRMSDWVADLIETAIAEGTPSEEVTPRGLQPKKKILEKLESKPQIDETGVPAYAKPPFWAGSKGG